MLPLLLPLLLPLPFFLPLPLPPLLPLLPLLPLPLRSLSAVLHLYPFQAVALRGSSESGLSRILASASSPAWLILKKYKPALLPKSDPRHWIRVGNTRKQTGLLRSRSRSPSVYADPTAPAGPAAPATAAPAEPDAVAAAVVAFSCTFGMACGCQGYTAVAVVNLLRARGCRG